MVRKAGIGDIDKVANLAVLMWSNHSVEDLINEFYLEVMLSFF